MHSQKWILLAFNKKVFPPFPHTYTSQVENNKFQFSDNPSRCSPHISFLLLHKHVTKSIMSFPIQPRKIGKTATADFPCLRHLCLSLSHMQSHTSCWEYGVLNHHFTACASTPDPVAVSRHLCVCAGEILNVRLDELMRIARASDENGRKMSKERARVYEIFKYEFLPFSK